MDVMELSFKGFGSKRLQCHGMQNNGSNRKDFKIYRKT